MIILYVPQILNVQEIPLRLAKADYGGTNVMVFQKLK